MANYEVIVIGGGHAGCEAASAAARMGQKTLMITTSLDTIGLLACSPSFGGPGRGHLLREIDAFGGLMPATADGAAIHYRHSGKNSSRWAPFVICDRLHYHRLLKKEIESINNLQVLQDTVTEIAFTKGRWRLSTKAEQKLSAKSLVITAGTFLKGRTKQNNVRQKAGRNNEISADELAQSLKSLNLKLGVFCTGTSPTAIIPKNNFQKMERQQYSTRPRRLSFVDNDYELKQAVTFKTFTSKASIDLLQGVKSDVSAKGPRYCPSLADKALKFPDKIKHAVYIQPESLNRREWFLNGLSMDFDYELQQKIVDSVLGLKGAQIVRHGYSVSYYYLKENQLFATMECRGHERLFLAGQVTGSNGYEEAAATGLLAGVNAALTARDEPALRLDRRTSYIGILANDLATKRLDEPYRMLPSKANNAFELRCDNADIRMLPIANKLSLITRQRAAQIRNKKKRIDAASEGKKIVGMTADEKREVSAIKKIRDYGLECSNAANWADTSIPRAVDYSKIELSKEAVEKLNRYRPVSIEEALRLNVPVGSVRALALYLERNSLRKETVSRETKK